MNEHCITCRFCDHSEGHVCTLGRLPIDDLYSDSCSSYQAQQADYRLCPDCQQSVNYDDMIWLNGKCTCPQCYIKRRAQLDAQEKED